MNYIITGGTGFIGTHLANLLHEQHPEAKIWNLDIVDPAKLDAMAAEREKGNTKVWNKKIQAYTTIKDWKSPVADGAERVSTFVECDVRKPIEKLPFTPAAEDVIFNFAAVHRTPGHPDRAYFETNLRGAENVCALAEKYGIKKIVFTSSIAPYGAAEEEKFEDTTLPTPNTAYGISKLVAEKIHQAWQAGGSDRQLTVVRPGVVFGKGENGNFTRLYWGIRGGKFAYPGRKDTVKACVYVKELVRFMLYRLEHHEQGAELYNCTFEPAYTIEQTVNTMKRVTGLTKPVPMIPSWLIMSAARVAQLLGSPMGICPARVRKLQISTNICGRKMAQSGYQYKWSFEQAIADWFEDNDRKWLK